MNSVRAFLLIGLLALFAGSAQAASSVHVNVVGGAPPSFTAISTISGINFGITTNGAFFFQNQSTFDWYALTITVTGVTTPGTLGCGSNAFTTCSATGSGPYTFMFSGGEIAHGDYFSVVTAGWKVSGPGSSPLTVQGEVTDSGPASIPEPGTLALFLIGATAVAWRRRLLRHA